MCETYILYQSKYTNKFVGILWIKYSVTVNQCSHHSIRKYISFVIISGVSDHLNWILWLYWIICRRHLPSFCSQIFYHHFIQVPAGKFWLARVVMPDSQESWRSNIKVSGHHKVTNWTSLIKLLKQKNKQNFLDPTSTGPNEKDLAYIILSQMANVTKDRTILLLSTTYIMYST